MGKKSEVTGCENKRLLSPLEAYILLPDRLCNVRPAEALLSLTPCMVDLISHAFSSCSKFGATALVPISWMKLKLEPQKMVSVVAAVIPSLNGEPCSHILKLSNVNKKLKPSDMLIFETIACVNEWDCEKLGNLHAVIIVPWPDPSGDVFERSKYPMPNAYRTKKALLNGGPVTVGAHPALYQKYYFDLNRIRPCNTQILFVSDWFAQSSAELTIALVAGLNSGILKESNSVYRSWLQSLVKQPPLLSSTTDDHGKQFSNPDAAQPSITIQGKRRYRSRAIIHLRRRISLKRIWERKHSVRTQAPSNNYGLIQPQYLSTAKVINGSRMGLVGLTGELPRTVARIAEQGLGMNIIYYQPHPESDIPYRHVGNLLELLEFSDVIVLADDTINHLVRRQTLQQAMSNRSPLRKIRKPEIWLTHEHFAHIRPHALLVCVTKIQCIDFTALAAALRYGQLRGAAITTPTVWTTQLTDLDGLRNLPNTFVLPPATSSPCAPREIRQNLAHHIVDLITQALYDVIGNHEDISDHTLPKIRKIPVPSLLLHSNISNSSNQFKTNKYVQSLLRIADQIAHQFRPNQLGASFQKLRKVISADSKVH